MNASPHRKNGTRTPASGSDSSKHSANPSPEGPHAADDTFPDGIGQSSLQPAEGEKDSERRLALYASYLEENAPDCESQGVILSVTWPSQGSRKYWLKEMLRAEPLFERLLVDDPKVELIQPLYGERNYGRSTETSDISRVAIAIECQRPLHCEAIAGFYRRVDPFAKIKRYCGLMPGHTGGNIPMDFEALKKLPLSYPFGICARYRACSTFKNLPPSTCDGLGPDSSRCAEEETCESALACFNEVPKDKKRKLWSDAPPPRSGRFPQNRLNVQ